MQNRFSPLVATLLLSIASYEAAAPQVIVTDPKTGQPLPNQPASSLAATIPASQVSPTQNPNQPTLAQLNKPSDAELSKANEALLANNAELQRQVDSLTTQTNVLVNERSSQLFMYGAYTAGVSMLLGLGIGWLVFGRKSGW